MRDQLPEHYVSILERFPETTAVLDQLRDRIKRSGPLDDKTAHLIQLAAAVGIMSEGALHSHARQAIAAGASRDEIYHCVLLLTTTIGFPRVAAAIKWLDTLLE